MRRNRGAFRDDSPVSRSDFTSARRQEILRKRKESDSAVFSYYGSGQWGSGDEQIDEVRDPIRTPIDDVRDYD